MQTKTRKLAGGFIPSSRFGLWAMDLTMVGMRFSWIRKLVAKQFSIQSLFERETPA